MTAGGDESTGEGACIYRRSVWAMSASPGGMPQEETLTFRRYDFATLPCSVKRLQLGNSLHRFAQRSAQHCDTRYDVALSCFIIPYESRHVRART
jgi:hypothetical protein